MDWMQTAFPLIGLILCAWVAVSLGIFAAQSYRLRRANREQFIIWQQQQRRRLDQKVESSSSSKMSNDGLLNGWRKFQIVRLQRETADAISVHLSPLDKKAIAKYRPGQYLTIKVQLPKTEKASIRCFTLSDACDDNHYRLTIKKKPLPVEAAAKSVSHFMNEELIVGDIVDVKRPAGDFCFDTNDLSPIVMLAAGVGITPMMSMIRTQLQTNSSRDIWLFYGNVNSKTEIFRQSLRDLHPYLPNFRLVNCFSNPLPTDVAGVDYHCIGRVTIDLIKKTLPNRQFKFYICGPNSFMEDLYFGLVEWGVPESRICFEAFGPATVSKKNTNAVAGLHGTGTLSSANPRKVIFRLSETEEVEGESQLNTILEIAEEMRVDLQSGCRSGNCGTCAVRLLKGNVEYPHGILPETEPGFCLACIARPVGRIEVEA